MHPSQIPPANRSREPLPGPRHAGASCCLGSAELRPVSPVAGPRRPCPWAGAGKGVSFVVVAAPRAGSRASGPGKARICPENGPGAFPLRRPASVCPLGGHGPGSRLWLSATQAHALGPSLWGPRTPPECLLGLQPACQPRASRRFRPLLGSSLRRSPVALLSGLVSFSGWTPLLPPPGAGGPGRVAGSRLLAPVSASAPPAQPDLPAS